MRVYVHPSKNEYLRTEDGIWVRNLCKPNVVPLSISDISEDADKRMFLDNEFSNRRRGNVYLDPAWRWEDVLVVSDGFNFRKGQEVLSGLPKSTVVVAVNGVLAKWRLERRINYYVVNNPYSQCLKFLPPDDRFPKCIASSRTNPTFMTRYKGDVFFYAPPDETNFTGIWSRSDHMIDDYRNPVCAAIALAYRFRVKRLTLFACDDSHESERPGMVQLENGLWSYPQQLVAQRVIDKMLYWLSRSGEIKIIDCSSGLKHEKAAYITAEELVKPEHNEAQ